MDLPPDLPPGSLPRLADLIVRRRAAILIVTLLLAAGGAWRASRLHLKTDMAELLPDRDPAVVVLRQMSGRINGVSHVVVGVESPSPAANRRFVDDLVPRVRALHLPAILDVEQGVAAERAFLQRHRFLYASRAQLEDARDRLRRAILRRKNPAFVDLTDEGGGAGALAQGRAELDRKEQELLARYPDGYFATRDRRAYAVVVRLDGSFFSEHHGEEVVRALRGLVARMEPHRYHPAMTVGLAGDVMTAVEERQALEDDLLLATGVCVVLIALVIVLFFGRLRAVPYAVAPAVCGVLVALAFAQAAFGSLNASTAFMGSIIVGNGINYAIIQMARYEEERRRGRGVRDAIAVALGATWRATLIASVGAAIAYGSLAITTFRGFSQFGSIGGVGMLMAWLVTVLALPAAWALLDRRAATATTPRLRGFAAAAPLARFTVRHPRLLLGLGALVTLAAAAPLPRYLRDPFEYDFRKLGSRLSQRADGPSALSSRLGPIFGRTLSPSFVIADDPSQVEEIRARLREQDRRSRILGEIRTVNDFLPGSPAVQARKLAVLAEIRGLIDKNRDLLDDQERADADRLRPPDGLRAIGPRDLPWSMRRYFTEVDGTIGRPVVYYPRHGVTVWDGRVQIQVAAVTRRVRLADGSTLRSSGKSAIFAGMIEAITRDGPVATTAAFLGVALLLVALTFRRGGWWLVLGVLAAGVLWMVGAAAWLGVRVNFLNFIALPITFGINVDYGINLLLRAQSEGRGRIEAAVAATGGAVGLCSLTTIIGYGALLVADNQALRSFGAMAILGEIACLAAALLLLPAALALRERRRRRGAAVAGTAQILRGAGLDRAPVAHRGA